MIESKHLQDQQDTTDFPSISDNINKNNVHNKIYEILSTFHYYLQQNDVHLWFLKLFQPKKLH
jgi:hypothetical protein